MQDSTERNFKHAEAFRDMESQILDLDTMVDILISARDDVHSNQMERLQLLITLFNDRWNEFAEEYRPTLESRTIEQENE